MYEQQENFLLLIAMADSYTLFCKLKCSADVHVLLEEHPIECLSEGHRSIVLNFEVLVDADHVLRACLQKNFADELGMARKHDDELKGAFSLQDDLFHLVSAHQLSVTNTGLQQQEVALVLILLVECVTKVWIVEDSMT